ncbi:hypothetical protein J1614_007162 [Plenodomus biglobosus]|nr:hypothetical protein J1614_007162 [Plenodomus biglobosus]
MSRVDSDQDFRSLVPMPKAALDRVLKHGNVSKTAGHGLKAAPDPQARHWAAVRSRRRPGQHGLERRFGSWAK